MLQHVAWFNEAPIEPNPAGGLRSTDGRVERRCLEPACALEDLGISCSVFGNLHDADPGEVSKLLQKLKTDIVVIGPFSDPSLLRLARAAKHLGCYIVADFGDQDSVSEDFQKLATIADQIVAGNLKALEYLRTQNLDGIVIPDTDADHDAPASAENWLACFKAIKKKPSLCANTNTPPTEHA